MKIKINGNWIQLEADSKLIDALTDLSLADKSGMAVAVNAEVVSKKNWEEYILKEDDELIIIEAAQGG